MKSQSGFTLIEMVAVIIILAIMAATALPRFANLSGEARASSISGLAGGLRSAVSLVKSKWLVGNSTLVSNVDMNGANVSVVASTDPGYTAANGGYPLATEPGIIFALDGAGAGYTSHALAGGAAWVFWPTGVTTSTTCFATYTSSTGVVALTATTAGCA